MQKIKPDGTPHLLLLARTLQRAGRWYRIVGDEIHVRTRAVWESIPEHRRAGSTCEPLALRAVA